MKPTRDLDVTIEDVKDHLRKVYPTADELTDAVNAVLDTLQVHTTHALDGIIVLGLVVGTLGAGDIIPQALTNEGDPYYDSEEPAWEDILTTLEAAIVIGSQFTEEEGRQIVAEHIAAKALEAARATDGE